MIPGHDFVPAEMAAGLPTLLARDVAEILRCPSDAGVHCQRGGRNNDASS
jgi:hypothetical protein